MESAFYEKAESSPPPSWAKMPSPSVMQCDVQLATSRVCRRAGSGTANVGYDDPSNTVDAIGELCIPSSGESGGRRGVFLVQSCSVARPRLALITLCCGYAAWDMGCRETWRLWTTEASCKATRRGVVDKRFDPALRTAKLKQAARRSPGKNDGAWVVA